MVVPEKDDNTPAKGSPHVQRGANLLELGEEAVVEVLPTMMDVKLKSFHQLVSVLIVRRKKVPSQRSGGLLLGLFIWVSGVDTHRHGDHCVK